MVDIAVLDDYQNVARDMADWSAVEARARLTVFNDHVAEPADIIERLEPFDAVCIMRERTPLTAEILSALPKLKLIASTGPRNASIDAAAAAERGIKVVHTGYRSAPTVEHTWALILAGARHITDEAASFRGGFWQICVGDDLAGKTLGIVGLGNIGGAVAKVAAAFGMRVIAWSENLTAEKASAAGAELVSKKMLFQQADIVTIHLVLSPRSRGIVAAADLALMKPTARLVNTSRGPIVVEEDLIEALRAHAIAGAAIDVFDTEPLPANHPFRRMPNVLATPHIGYVTSGLYETFYRDTVKNLLAWLNGLPAA